ncbi:MAG: lysine 2,3-aminomutase [Rhodospirillaceae bacterium]|nr:lysine 2,3-aminomutase [Rhodospirillaceae bacterium]|tara:strand:- start:2151 stop:3212 length:1062 start_codon:yes stop_codon:yes gene_type:complete
MKAVRNLVHSVQSKHVSSPETLVERGLIPPDHFEAVTEACKTLPVRLTSHIAAQIDSQNLTSPLAKQFVPSPNETFVEDDEIADPIGDVTHSPVAGIVHRYPDRVLLTPVLSCPVYCRFCFRREFVGDGLLNNDDLESAIDYIRNHPEIWEVILSGGDPLILSQRRLGEIIDALDAIDHVAVIRVHTRVPVVDPHRVTRTLTDALKRKTPVFIVLHCNHADELVPEARDAIAQFVDNGFPVLSQSVLLKDVNDNSDTLATLMKTLVQCRVKPYYLHHGDKAQGTSHFRTALAVGRKLISQLRGQLSGLCQPTYMLDIPGGHGKIPAAEDYLKLENDGSWTVVDWKGNTHQYLD